MKREEKRLIDATVIVKNCEEKIERIKERIEILEKNKGASFYYDLTAKIHHLQDRIEEYYFVIEVLNEAPTIDAEPVIHAHWIDKGDYAECSNCGANSGTQFDGVQPIPHKTKYCHNCKAKMDKEV